MLSATDRHGSRRGSWKTSPTRGSGPSIGRSSSVTAPRSGVEQSGGDAEERALAAAVRADERDDLAGLDRRGSKPSSAWTARSPSGPANRDTPTSRALEHGRRVTAVIRAESRDDRRDRRVEPDVGIERRVVKRRGGRGSARAGGRLGSCRGSRPGRPDTPRSPSRPRIAAPTTAVSRTRRDRDREAGDVGLDLVPRLAPGRAAADPHLVDPDAGGEDRLGDVADRERGRLEDRPGEVAAPMAERQADERAAGGRVPDRRALAGEVRQEERRRRRRAGWRPPPRSALRSSRRRRRSSVRNQSIARPVAAIAPPTLNSPGSGAIVANEPGTLNGSSQ